jgi:hypothetical protein
MNFSTELLLHHKCGDKISNKRLLNITLKYEDKLKKKICIIAINFNTLFHTACPIR